MGGGTELKNFSYVVELPTAGSNFNYRIRKDLNWLLKFEPTAGSFNSLKSGPCDLTHLYKSILSINLC